MVEEVEEEVEELEEEVEDVEGDQWWLHSVLLAPPGGATPPPVCSGSSESPELTDQSGTNTAPHQAGNLQ